MNSQLQNYKFKSIYRFLSIIQDSVDCQFDFWNFNAELFVNSALKFNKISLLHIYVSSTLACYFDSDFRENGDLKDSADILWWIDLMHEYHVEPDDLCFDDEEESFAEGWHNRNNNAFDNLFLALADEIVHILFINKIFLNKFNLLVARVIKDTDQSYTGIITWPENSRNTDGTIKRSSIPEWVKRAVFHRDKGRCVFCNKDLTDLVSIYGNKNYDHIVPLKQFGANDPCNIQLTCEKCNKSKGDKHLIPDYNYQSWW